MAFNPSPKVAVARDAARKQNKPVAVVFWIDPDAGTLEYASYGETKELCKLAKSFGDAGFDAMMRKAQDDANP